MAAHGKDRPGALFRPIRNLVVWIWRSQAMGSTSCSNAPEPSPASPWTGCASMGREQQQIQMHWSTRPTSRMSNVAGACEHCNDKALRSQKIKARR